MIGRDGFLRSLRRPRSRREGSIAWARWARCLVGSFCLLIPPSIAVAATRMPDRPHVRRLPATRASFVLEQAPSLSAENGGPVWSVNACATFGVDATGDETGGSAGSSTAVAPGLWGGEHIRLDVVKTGAKIEFDCAFGTIDEPLRAGDDGSFEARGTYVFESGGATRKGDPRPRGRPAVYRGRIDGDEMRLTVTLSDSGHEIGTFTLHLGRAPHLDKCG
jgi:hypothetical protein